MESVWEPKPLGVHKPYAYLAPQALKRLLEQAPLPGAQWGGRRSTRGISHAWIQKSKKRCP